MFSRHKLNKMNNSSKIYSSNLSTNSFNQLGDNTQLIYDEHGNIDIKALIPEYAEFLEAMKNGKSWYDIMYPNGEKPVKNSIYDQDKGEWEMVDKKRKIIAPPSDVSHCNKKKKKS